MIMMRIKSAAVKHKDTGIIFVGSNHAEIINGYAKENNYKKNLKGCEQGFITECGKFYGRHQSGIIAIKAGQIKKLKYPSMGLDSTELRGDPELDKDYINAFEYEIPDYIKNMDLRKIEQVFKSKEKTKLKSDRFKKKLRKKK